MRRRVVVLLVVPLASVMLFGSLASAQPAAGNTWAGVWSSDFGPLTLDAGGSGSYTGFTPGTVTGSVTGNVDKGTWNQPGTPPKGGTFTFTMSADGKSFTGEWAYTSGGCGSACGWNGTCTSGECLKNGEVATTTTTPESNGAKISVQFRGFANHPKNIRSPLGRHDGWKISTEPSINASPSLFVHYIDGDIVHRSTAVLFRIVGKHLVSETKYGAALVRVAELNLELRSFIPGFARTSTLPQCHEGAKGTITLTDDPQVAGQTGPPHNLDKIVIDIPRCNYLDATITNANSFANEPFEGGQQADVTITK